MKNAQAKGNYSAATPVEMAEINRYTRCAYEPEEVYTFSLVLCDNEVDRDFERFSVESLKKLQELFLGKICIIDHERNGKTQAARIYHTQLKGKAGETTQEGEQLVRLTAKAYLPKTSSNGTAIELIESGILKEVSVSCAVKRGVCSICGEERCKHQKGKVYGGKLAHTVLTEPTDAYECAFVAVPQRRPEMVSANSELTSAGCNLDLKNTTESKLCPLLKTNGADPTFLDCERAKCAWWDKEARRCAMMTMANCLTVIAEEQLKRGALKYGA